MLSQSPSKETAEWLTSAKWQKRQLQTPTAPQKQKQAETVRTNFVRTLENRKKFVVTKKNADLRKK